MADDLPIKISLDPGPAAQGAKKVSTSLADVEKAAEDARKANASLAATIAGLPPPPPSVATGIKRISENLKQMGFNSKELGLKLNELAKQASFGLIQQGAQLANEALKELGISAGTTGAAIGFQLAGPLGAAAGAIGEIVGTGLGNWMGEEDRLAAQGARNTIAFAKAMDAFAAGVQNAEAAWTKSVEQWRQTLPWAGGMTKVLEEQTNAWVAARDKVLAYGAALASLTAGKVRGGTLGTTTTDDINVTRGLRDAQLELKAATTSYGDVLRDTIGKENSRKDAIENAKRALAEGAITQKQYADYMKQFATQTDAATLALRKFIAEEAKLRNVRDTIDTRSDVTSGFAIPEYKPDAGVDEAIRLSSLPGYEANPFDTEDAQRAASQKKLPDTIKETNEQLELMKSAAQSAGTQLVEMFAKGDFSAQSFKSVLESIALQLATGFVSQRIGAAFPSGVPGHATGAYYPPSGTGSTDSQLVAFRKSPWESVYVNTPGQDANMRQSGGGLRVVQVSADPRALAPAVGGDDDTVLLQWASKNRDKLRRILD